MTIPSVDVAIIGGGIAGSSLAIVLQRDGLSTAVIEREPAFRDRVRGEACHPWGVKELYELGLESFVFEAGGQRIPNWTQYRDRDVDSTFAWEEAFPGIHAEIGFSHPALQERLLRGATEAGAIVHRPARASIARQRDSWLLQIDGPDGVYDLQARYLIAADGKTSATRKLWGCETVIDPPHHQFGGLLVKNLNLDPTSSHQGFHTAGFLMIFPQGNDLWRVYYVGPDNPTEAFGGSDRIGTYLKACAACFPEDAFANATPSGPLAFFPNSHVSATRIAGEMAVAIGDAAGAPDPSQGHGMSLLWRDVRVLRDLLRTESWQDVAVSFAVTRRSYETILRTHAAWVAPLTTNVSEAGLALQAQVELARADDPEALGYASIFALGPDSQPTDDDARAQFFGEHKAEHPIRIDTPLDKID
ncbi:MAG: FAD-dependent monooxygenase [Thermomicrobiales bacterium]|nr:FAD-dependent monooxygenase [Thermomicrobiales bacterium]MCO5229250.1 FAD-dependent monooxygenase [Thermomicrobiales bacterium]